MNLAPLRTTIFKETAIFMVIGSVLGVIAFVLSMQHDSMVQTRISAIAAVTQTINEKQALENQFDRVREKKSIYDESLQHATKIGLFIDSQAVRDLFNEYQSLFFLKRISVEMRPIETLTADPKYTRKHFVANRSKISVQIDAMSDEDIYKVIQSMQRELPGFIRISGLNMRRNTELTKDVLTAIQKEGVYNLIAAQVDFDWFGMKATDDNSDFNKYVPKPKGAKAESKP